jgi:hypothetical protein
LSKIVATYCKRGIPFFLFSPGLVGLRAGIEHLPVTILAANVTIVYENGANVGTSFITNLETDYIIRACPELTKIVEDASKQVEAKIRKQVPKYKYPAHVVTIAQVAYFSHHDTEFGVRRGEAVRIGAMDEQKSAGKTCFGGGLLMSDRAAIQKAAAEKAAAEKAAAEKAAAEKAAAEKADAIAWKLSEREKEIVNQLS